jgi:acyl dehydratase
MTYYEDLQIGAKNSFGSYRVTREEALEFAEKYDPQAFHLDDEAAASTHFGRLSCSGWHTAAMTMRMIVDNLDETANTRSLGAAGIDDLRWIRPVFPGDTLRVETEIVDKAPWPGRPEMGVFRSKTMVFNQDDKPVMSYIAKVLMQRREAASG